VLRAHSGHLGTLEGATVTGDSIFKGTLDNASDIATLIETARAKVTDDLTHPEARRGAVSREGATHAPTTPRSSHHDSRTCTTVATRFRHPITTKSAWNET
jgi:hypothetical protein